MKRYAGLLIIAAFLLLHLLIINDYGFTWDFHFHFFGGGKLLGIEPSELEPRNLPFVEPDPRRAWTLPYGPLMSIPPVASYLFLYKTLNILPADSAYHLPIILWGIAGTATLFFFLKEAYSSRAGILAALFVGLMPRYFADLHNNMKDIPSAAIFAVNMWLVWRLMRYRRTIDLVLAVIAFAVALNIKINSVFIPVIAAVWISIGWIRKDPGIRKKLPFLLTYFIAAPAAAFLLWWMFWPNPVGQLKHAYLTFGVGTNNIEVILNGKWYCSGSTVPWYYPLWYLAITTPLPMLVLFLVGLASKQKKSLFILWLLLPLSRYLLPSVGVIDGIRHFEEVLFPIAAIAALGADRLLSLSKRSAVSYALVGIMLIPLVWNIISYHPYQIAYFNELVGGTKGAMGNYDLDYWGTSQKKAVEWVNNTAPPGSKVHIVMAAAVAGQYLRPDLLPNLNKFGYDESDYVILLNRQSFLYRFFYAYEYLLHHKPVYTVTVAGAPLTWVFDNKPENKTPRQVTYWQDEDPCIIKYWRGEHP